MIEATPELAGRIAVITGGGSGLGAAMGRAFASKGMAVAALDIDGPAAAATAASLAEEFGVATTATQTDVGDPESVAAAARHIEAMLAHRPMREGDLATPDHAIRNLLNDLIENQPYILTHGGYRSDYNLRRDAIEAAFDRMEAS